jgi:hypothetical protein
MMSAMSGDRRPIAIWVEDESQDFGSGDGSISKRGAAWDLDEAGNQGATMVGEVQRTDRPSPGGSAGVTAIIHFNGKVFPRGTVIAKGALPYDHDKRDIVGTGLIEITTGTGGHTGISGVFEVESVNPKKYRQQ